MTPTVTATRVADLLWLRVPQLVPARAPVLRAALGDGAYLRRWPTAAVSLPLLALLAGVVCGWRPWAPNLLLAIPQTYTSSVPVLVLLCALGFVGAGNGVYLTAGFVVADLLLHRPGRPFSARPLVDGVTAYAAAGLTYVFLAALVVTVPLVANRIARGMRLPRLQGTWSRSVSTLGAAALGVAVLVWCWTQTVPTLVRPVWTWQGFAPPAQAIQPLQHWWGLVVAVAVLVTGLRVVLEDRATRELPPPVPERIAPVATRTRPRAVSLGVRTAVTTFVLSGLFSAWWEALGFALLFAGSLLLRTRLSRSRRWTSTVDRVPVVLRLLAATGFSILVGNVVVGALWHRTESFLPILVSAALTLLLVAVLLPVGATPAPSPRATEVPR